MRLQTIRKSRKLSQSKLARLSGVNLKTLQKYESGERDINKAEAGIIFRLARSLSCEMELLIDHERELVKMQRIITNEHGVEIDFEIVVNLMNDEIREFLHDEMAPCAEQSFFDAYCKKHLEKFGEPFELAKENPIY